MTLNDDYSMDGDGVRSIQAIGHLFARKYPSLVHMFHHHPANKNYVAWNFSNNRLFISIVYESHTKRINGNDQFTINSR